MTELHVLQSTSVPKAVQKEIEKMILNGSFEAGQKLGEVELADRLGVSRGPVREAFRGLEEAGLISVSKNRGVFVPVSTRVQGRCWRARIKDSQITELSSMVNRMDALLLLNGLAEYFTRNLQFHERILEMAGNPKLLEIYRRLINKTHLMRRSSISKGGGRLVSSKEHREIERALATRNADEAIRTMRSHVLNGRDRYMATQQPPAGAMQKIGNQPSPSPAYSDLT